MNDWSGFFLQAEQAMKRADTLLTNSTSFPEATKAAIVRNILDTQLALDHVRAWVEGRR